VILLAFVRRLFNSLHEFFPFLLSFIITNRANLSYNFAYPLQELRRLWGWQEQEERERGGNQYANRPVIAEEESSKITVSQTISRCETVGCNLIAASWCNLSRVVVVVTTRFPSAPDEARHHKEADGCRPTAILAVEFTRASDGAAPVTQDCWWALLTRETRCRACRMLTASSARSTVSLKVSRSRIGTCDTCERASNSWNL
jgi:hypothetical protein